MGDIRGRLLGQAGWQADRHGDMHTQDWRGTPSRLTERGRMGTLAIQEKLSI